MFNRRTSVFGSCRKRIYNNKNWKSHTIILCNNFENNQYYLKSTSLNISQKRFDSVIHASVPVILKYVFQVYAPF